MNTWYCKSKEFCSFYYHPFTWHKLLSLFEPDDLCTIEHFSGVGKDEVNSFYKSWYGCSPEFLAMKEPMRLSELKSLVKTFVKWPHEFKLAIGTVKIERGITNGIVFTADEQTINHLTEKLNVPKELLRPSLQNKLVSMGKTGRIKVEGEFTKSEILLDHVYDELMRKVSQNYFKFMDALASAPLEGI